MESPWPGLNGKEIAVMLVSHCWKKINLFSEKKIERGGREGVRMGGQRERERLRTITSLAGYHEKVQG